MTRLESWLTFIPETVLIVTILYLFVCDFVTTRRKIVPSGLFVWVSVIGLSATIITALGLSHHEMTSIFYGMLAFDPMAVFTKVLFSLGTLAVVFFSYKSKEMQKIDAISYHVLLLTTTLGALLLAASTNLLMLTLALEMVSIPSYLLAGSLQNMRRSSEAALKYVIYGGMASGLMLFGFSILYGLSGTLNLHTMYQFFLIHPATHGTLGLALVLSFAGFAYKIAAFPFHMWAPDVYEGSPIFVSAFFSVVPKAAGIIALVRFCLTAFAEKWPEPFVPLHGSGWVTVLVIISVATMTFGNLAALAQTNLKRLLAYSSIAHAGTMLLGFAAMNGTAIEAILFYLVVYFIMNLGAFLSVLIIYNQMGTETLEGYKGFGKRNGAAAYLGILMGVFLLSLAGLPPLAGFIGKLYVFSALVRAGLFWLAVIGVLNSVISLYYYVRILKVMFFEEPADKEWFEFGRFSHPFILTILAVLTLYFGIFWNSLAEWVRVSAAVYF